jgi:hypothetical protein
MPKKIQKAFKTKKRFGQNKVNHIQKTKRKSKDMAVVFDEKERHSFLAGIYNAKNKRKEFFEKRKEEEEKTQYREKNKQRRQYKKETVQKYKEILGDTQNKDTFLKDYAKEKITTKTEEMKNSKDQPVFVKTSFLNI